MVTIKKLKLKLKSGLLSELQSDTIFGHFAWRFKEYHDEKLNDFLEFFINDNPIFTISDGFFEKHFWDENREEVIDKVMYFPKPLKLTPPKFINNNKKERLINFIKQKERKGRTLITLEELNYFLRNDMENFEKSIEQPLTKPPKFEEDLRVSVEIDRNTLKSKEGNLFSYHPKYLDDDTFIVIYIKILNNEKFNEYECENILRDVFEIGYGKKKSSGYGQFEVLSFEDFNGFEESSEPNGFISLSHYLPSNNDKVNEGYYDINVKYGKFGEEKSNSHNPFKPPILLLKPGSCFLTDERKDFYGRVIKSVSDYHPNTIHNGIAFTLACRF